MLYICQKVYGLIMLLLSLFVAILLPYDKITDWDAPKVILLLMTIGGGMLIGTYFLTLKKK